MGQTNQKIYTNPKILNLKKITDYPIVNSYNDTHNCRHNIIILDDKKRHRNPYGHTDGFYIYNKQIIFENKDNKLTIPCRCRIYSIVNSAVPFSSDDFLKDYDTYNPINDLSICYTRPVYDKMYATYIYIWDVKYLKQIGNIRNNGISLPIKLFIDTIYTDYAKHNKNISQEEFKKIVFAKTPENCENKVLNIEHDNIIYNIDCILVYNIMKLIELQLVDY